VGGGVARVVSCSGKCNWMSQVGGDVTVPDSSPLPHFCAGSFQRLILSFLKTTLFRVKEAKFFRRIGGSPKNRPQLRGGGEKGRKMVEKSLKSERKDDEEQEKNPPKFLKLNSINGATNSLANVLPVDQTPTPTKIMKLASELFPSESNNTVTAAKSEVNSSQPNPFDKSFKQSTSQSPENGTNSGNEPVIQELENVDENIEEHDDHEFVEEIVDEEEIEAASEKFKRPEPVGSEEMIQVSTTTINSIAGQEGQAQPQFQMLPTASGQMLVQIPQPVASPGTRLVMAAPEMAAQAGQGKYVVMQQPATYKIGK